MNLDNSPALVKSEFLAVVLAGFGHELHPLTGNHGEEPCPKALLPIGNKPMLDYILGWLEQSGITDVLLVCPIPHRISIADHIHSDTSASFPSLRIDLQTYGDQQDTSFGTCTILRHFTHRIERDFIVLPCDFIPPASLPLSIILNKFRQESMLDDSILTTCWYEAPRPDKHASDEWGPHQSVGSIVWDEKTGTLLQVDAGRAQRGEDEVQLRLSMLSKYPRSKLSSTLQDSHVYVCNRSILELLRRKPAFRSFRREFIPWLCKANRQDMPEKSNSPVGIIPHKAANGFAARASNLYNYLELNRQFLVQMTPNAATGSVNRMLVDAKAQLSADSVLGHSTRVEERASIKNSVIGRHCVIGKMAKVVGCVILDHCVIGEGSKLDGCILGKNTKVGDRSDMLRCITQAGYEVDSGGSYRNEKLDVSDWTAGSAYEEDFDDSGSSDSEAE